MDFDLPLRGVAAGFIIAAPVGPVNVLCLQKTLAKGWRWGMLSGLGAAAADSLYGGIAGFGITLVIHFLIAQEFWFRLIGGMLLMGIGVTYYRKPAKPLDLADAPAQPSGGHTDFVAAFLLNVANPTTVLSFLAVLATLGLGKGRSLGQSTFLVACIFSGSMLWWTILASAANLFRNRVAHGGMRWMNRVAGLAIGGFGLLNVLLSRGVPR